MALATLTSHVSLVTLLLLLVLPMALCLDIAPAHVKRSDYEKETVLTYYIIEKFNDTVIAVAGIQGQKWSPTTFATLLVTDVLLAEKPSLYSPEAGRVNGLVAVTSKDGTYNFQTSTTRFTKKKYNGSTLETKGVFNRASGLVNKFVIEGGTGMFKRAKGVGYLTLIEQTSSYTISNVTYRFVSDSYDL